MLEEFCSSWKVQTQYYSWSSWYIKIIHQGQGQQVKGDARVWRWWWCQKNTSEGYQPSRFNSQKKRVKVLIQNPIKQVSSTRSPSSSSSSWWSLGRIGKERQGKKSNRRIRHWTITSQSWKNILTCTSFLLLFSIRLGENVDVV